MVSDSFPAERLLDSFGRELLRKCFAYLEDEALAEDALQETFLRAWRAWDRFEGRCSEKTWLTGIAMNVCRSMLRKKRPIFLADLPECADTAPEPSDGTVLRAIHGLKSKYREVVLLYYYQELSQREIAQALHLSVPNVSARFCRGREMLRKALKGWYFDE